MNNQTSTTNTAPQEPLTLEKLTELMESIPPRPRFLSMSIMSADQVLKITSKRFIWLAAHPDYWVKAKLAAAAEGLQFDVEDVDERPEDDDWTRDRKHRIRCEFSDDCVKLFPLPPMMEFPVVTMEPTNDRT